MVATGNGTHTAHGILRVDAQSAELAMTEALSPQWYGDSEGMSDGKIRRVPAIHGRADGMDYTLLDCDLPVELRVATIVSIDVHAILRGAHVSGRDDGRFTGLCLRVQNLNSFAGPTKQALADERIDGREGRTPRLAATVGDLLIALEWTSSRSIEHTPDGTIQVNRELVQFDVRWPGPVSIDQCREVIQRLEDLVTFVTGVASVATFRALVEPAPRRSDDARSWPTISYLHETASFAARTVRVPPTVVLHRSEIDWPELAPLWFGLYDDFLPVLEAVIGQRYLPGQFVNSRALHAVIAAEQAYRALGEGDNFLTEGELRKFRRAIRRMIESTESVPEHVRATLGQLILGFKSQSGFDIQLRGLVETQYSIMEEILALPKSVRQNLDQLISQVNRRITLDARLRGIVDFVGPVATKMLGGPSGADRWIVAARRSRNDLGHTGHTAKYGPAALEVIARATEGLLELVLAKKLGASETLLTSIIRRRFGRIGLMVEAHLPIPGLGEEGGAQT